MTGKKPDIDADLVRKLASLLDETGLTEIEYGTENWHLRVGKAKPLAPAAPASDPAAAVAAAVGHVGVDLEIVPALGEGRPIGQGAEAAERVAHVRRLDKGIARASNAVADARGVLQAGSDLAHELKSIIPLRRPHMI